jgi:RNA polymerase sigma-70 factor (ECF subfamily)
MGEGEHTTQVLVGRWRAGDAAARATLIARIDPLLRRFARGRVPQLLRHEQDTADLVQSTWLRVLDRLGSISLQHPGDFFAYLRMVLINALRESLRRQGVSPIDFHADAEAVTSVLAASNVDPADWLAYEQILAAMPPEHRTLVLMRYEFGMSFAEISTELGETPNAVRMRLNRALARIAQVTDADPVR